MIALFSAAQLTLVELPRDFCVKFVACGQNMTVVVSQDDDIYVCGSIGTYWNCQNVFLFAGCNTTNTVLNEYNDKQYPCRL